jgi:hypothetical protein
LANNSKTKISEYAEATFAKKERQAREGAKAFADYEAQANATREKTARLRTLRLAKEAADREAAAAKKPAALRAKPR